MLLISPRQGAEVAAAEYRDFCVAAGLREGELEQRMLDHADSSLGDLRGFDGVFVGGSSLNVTNPSYSPWQQQVHAELKALIDSPIPTFLVCYGNTLVAGLYGGEVGRTHPEDSGETIVELTEYGRKDPLTQGFPQRFSSLTGHTENVISPAPGSQVLATGPRCPIQMVRANASTWACQFHADMDAHAMKTRMDFYRDYGYFAASDYERIIAELPSIDTTWSNRLLANFVAYCRDASPYGGKDRLPE